MVFEYVAVENKQVEVGKSLKIETTIIADGKVTAWSRDVALVKVGALLGKKLTDEVEVTVRPF